MVLCIPTIIRCTLLYISLLILLASELGLKREADAKPMLTVLEISQEDLNNFKPLVGTNNLQPSHGLRNAKIFRKNIAPVIGIGRTINYQQQQQQQQQQHQRGFHFGNGREPSTVVTHSSSLSPLVGGNNNNNNYNTTTIGIGSLRKALLGLQNPKLLGGDILIRTGRRRKDHVIKFQRSALVSPVSLWPSGVIFYELDPSVAHLTDLIWKVMQQFHDETCIKFMPRRNNEPDYLRIEALKGCFSYIGRIGGEQTLSLGDGCEYRGTIAHELFHAVGFYHHQNRSDRDDFLEILWDNIARGKESQFSKMAPQENILLNEFDYDSIMLYGPRTFGKNMDKVTMKPKREGVVLLEVVEKQGLSLLDIDSVNKLYKCNTSRRDDITRLFD